MSTKRVKVERHAQGATRRRQLHFRKRISCWKGAEANFRYLQNGELRESHSTCATLRRQGSGINLAVILKTCRGGRWPIRTIVGSSRHSRRLNHFAMIPGSPSWPSIASWSCIGKSALTVQNRQKFFDLSFVLPPCRRASPAGLDAMALLGQASAGLGRVLHGDPECGRALLDETISGRNGDQDRSCAPTSGLRSRRAQHLVFSGLQSAA